MLLTMQHIFSRMKKKELVMSTPTIATLATKVATTIQMLMFPKALVSLVCVEHSSLRMKGLKGICGKRFAV